MPRTRKPRKRSPMPEETAVPAKRRASEWAAKEEIPAVKFDALGGCEEQILKAYRLSVHLRFPELYTKLGIIAPKGFLLHGPPGTGKTAFAKALAGQLNMNLVASSSTELVAGISGESERRIRELFVQASECAPSILLIDDIDVIAAKRENAQREMERRIVAQLVASLDELEDSKVLVIGTTNRLEVLDSSLRRAGRFDKDISLGIPDEPTRLKILEIATRGMKLHEDVSLKTLARLTPGYVGADLVAFVREASLAAVDRVFETSILPPKCNGVPTCKADAISSELSRMLNWLNSPAVLVNSKLDDVFIEADDFRSALSVVVPSAKREGFATVPDVNWSNIGALREVRKELEWSILKPIQQPELFESLDYNPMPQGILLCGPPGCGKTLLGKAIANEAGMNFISVKGPELLSMFVGESERAVRTIFQRAKDSSPCVIFFDEIDALCPKRSSNESSGSSRLVNQLLTEMDGMENRKQVFLIGATNRPDMVDPAILRPGRLDRILYVGFPSAEDRAEILMKVTKDRKHPRIAHELSFSAIVGRLENFTGADLVALVGQATKFAAQEVASGMTVEALGLEHFEKAIATTRPSVNAADYEKMEKKYSLRRNQ